MEWGERDGGAAPEMAAMVQRLIQAPPAAPGPELGPQPWTSTLGPKYRLRP